MKKPTVAILIPCFNEEKCIEKVIADAKKAAPSAVIYVYDNNSTDRTALLAKKSGAVVRTVSRQGKGFVVRAMFEHAREDILVLIDGDDTYSMKDIERLIGPVMRGECDMAVGARLAGYRKGAFRNLHVFGNTLVRSLINYIFDSRLTDIMTGYRALTRQMARKLPIVAKGFEVETEWTILALTHGYQIQEIELPYRPRGEGSFSKLRTFPDGIRVLWTIFKFFKDVKPLTFFGLLALSLFAMGGGIWGLIYIGAFSQVQGGRDVGISVAEISVILGMVLLCIGLVLNTVVEKHNQILAVLKKGPL